MSTGWGIGGYGLGAYGEGDGAASVDVSGVSATGEIGTIAVMTPFIPIYLTGLAATVNQGNILVWGETPVPAPGSWVPVSGAPSGGWGPIAPPTTDWVPVVT